MDSKKWSENAWKAAEGIYNSILQQAFIKELADGSLAEEKFLFYLGQDAHYLNTYCRSLAHVASRLKRNEDVEAFLRFASDGIFVERALHESFLKGKVLPPMSPTCKLYTSVEEASALDTVSVEAAALLPCFWVYQRVGEHILQTATNLDSNPYARWIETYGDETFAQSTRKAIEICDRLAEEASEEERRRMTEIFITCTRLEWMFWDSAYALEQWKI